MHIQKTLGIPLVLCSLLAMRVTNAEANGSCNASTPGTFTTLDVPGATFVSATGINAQGDIVGRYIAAGVTHGFLWSDGTFYTIDVPGGTFTSALDINPRGDIVGNYRSGGVTHGFLFSGGIFTAIDIPGASSTVVVKFDRVY
jgi:probable HAF family extracellular repeat protein